MKLNRLLSCATALVVAAFAAAPAQQNVSAEPNLSMKNEIQQAIQKGANWLKSQQNKEKGFWSEEENPAITALALSALMGDPSRDKAAPLAPEVTAGYQFLREHRQQDGGIYVKGLANYNTSLSLMAFLALNEEKDQQLMLAARRYLIGLQQDYDTKGTTDNVMDGGIGYGGSSPHSDLSNTTFGLEALYYSKALLADTGASEDKKVDLDWAAAIQFVSRCQNLTATNASAWASDDPGLKGGFIYDPENTKSGKVELPGGKVALRSYGSMTYAGLLSFIYAGLTPDDQRVKAAREWLSANYTLEENPGMKLEGLYYYYHTMAKALSISKTQELVLKDGTKINWREDLARKLLNAQNGDGYWVNTAGRWKESDKIMVTAYALMSLEHIYRGL